MRIEEITIGNQNSLLDWEGAIPNDESQHGPAGVAFPPCQVSGGMQ
jgi:hypothetical protein